MRESLKHHERISKEITCYCREHVPYVPFSLIDKTDGFRPKKRENYWMRTLKTVAPLGLDVESAV